MTADLELLLREAQEDQVNRAPRLERITSGLPERARLRARRRRTRVGAATVALVAVVAVPVLLSRHPTAHPAQPAVAASAPALKAYPLRWSPTWLPTAYKESSRIVTLDGGVATGSTRLWTTTPVGPGTTTQARPGIELVVGPSLGNLDGLGSVVDIRGMQGRYVPAPPGTGHTSSVRWNVDSNLSLTVTASRVTLSQADLLRVARSVVTDGAVSLTPPAVAGLPAGFVATSYSQGGAPGPAGCDCYRSTVLRQGDQRIQILTSRVSPVRGTSLQLGSGALISWTDDLGTAWRSVVLDRPGNGGQLTVSGTAQVDPQALLNVAKLDPASAEPDWAWVGGRP